MLALRGDLDRSEAERFLRDAFFDLVPQACCYVWQGWQSAIAMLGQSNLVPLVRKAFDQGFIDESWLGFDDFQQDLKNAIEHPDEFSNSNDGPYTLFGDAIDEFSTWYGFSDQYEEDRARRKRQADAERELAVQSQPYANPFKGVGRNDPCPCGSGKKFKKCCLQ